jgi:cell division protein FtsN
MYSVLAGLLIGLAIAAVVAFYVTRAPMPFVDKATRQAEQSKMPDLSHTNPNQGLSGGTVTVPPAPGPADADNDSHKTDDLGALIATLPDDDAKKPAPVAPAIPVPAAPPLASPAPVAKPAATPAAPKVASAPATASPSPAANGTYFLQAGAYKKAADADSVRARILLLGLQASVQRAEVNGVQWNRVRVGPFNKLDDMNRARIRLADNKIESTVIRQ